MLFPLSNFCSGGPSQFPSVSLLCFIRIPGTFCFCFVMSYLLLYHCIFLCVFLFCTILHFSCFFFSFSRVFPSLTACPESEFHDASRSWCSTLMITCSDTRMRTAALHLPTSVFFAKLSIRFTTFCHLFFIFFSLNFILDVLFASKPRPLCDEHRPVLQLLCYRQWCRIAFGAFPSEVAGHPSGFHQMTCASQRLWEIRPIPFS